ncbi:MAG: hypothetical protein WB763_24430 [Terriglobia bacterium]|jgi:hypothetical protein
MKKTTRRNDRLSIEKVLAEFQKPEESQAHRNGTFKIDAPFEQALKAILKAKPGKTKA